METIQKPLITQGWLRALIFLTGVLLIVYGFQVFGDIIINHITAGSESGDTDILNFAILYAIMGFFIFIITWVMRKFVDRESFKSIGFFWTGYSNEAGLGFFAALSILGVGTIFLIASGFVSFISATFEPAPLLLEIGLMIIVAFVEEVMFRGYLLNNLMQSMNKWIALAISSILFALFHQTNPAVTSFASINIFLAGMLIGLNYIFTKNLWFGIFFHFAWNYFQGPVLGYDVSGLRLNSLLQQSITGPALWTGGPFGFEGSLLCPFLFLTALIVFTIAFIKRYQPAVH